MPNDVKIKKEDFIIGVDMDDTIENLCKPWCEWLNEKHNLNVNWEDVDCWDMTQIYPTLTKSEIYAPLSLAEFWLTVDAIPGSRETIFNWIADGYKVYIITTTHYKIVKEKLKNCLFRLFPFIDRHNVVITCNKQLIKCDVLIDDGPHNIVGDYVGLLMSAPHNRYFDSEKHSTVTRVHSWSEIDTIVRGMVE